MNMVFKPEDFKPVDGNILVQPGPVKKIKTVQFKPQTSGKIDTVKEVEKEYEKLPTITRIGKVIAIADGLNLSYTVGDWVVYRDVRAQQQKLDLIAKTSDDDKCPILMRAYEVLAKINITE